MIYDFHPKLSRSQLEFRIRLAEKRLSSYPLDTLDFIMMDLEHPKGKVRHAHQCSTDLTGRTVEFLAEAHDVLPNCDETRLSELFNRMMLKREEYPNIVRRYYTYLKYKGDYDAWSLIKGVYDKWADEFEKEPSSMNNNVSRCASYVEGIAEMYELTGDKRYIPLSEKLAEVSLSPFMGAHSHGLMTILRAMLKMGKLTGDDRFLQKVIPYRNEILKNQYADGSIAECFPMSRRTEGCSTADWIMLNLRYYDLTKDEEALQIAEHSMLNGLFFNQFITGGFGHRNYRKNGYGTGIEEAWWCCTQTGGMAMCEYARHAVQLEKDENGARIRVNYPVPGNYTLNLDGKTISVRIISEYPAKYNANVTVIGAGDMPVIIRKPYYTGKAVQTEHKMASEPDGRTVTVDMPIGHYAEKRKDGWCVKYGPLLLAPMVGDWNDDADEDYKNVETGAPAGYIAETIKGSSFSILEPDEKDENGFWQGVEAGSDIPEWMYFDDGIGSHTGTMMKAPANVTLLDAAGGKMKVCFHPVCYATSNLTLHNMPLCFGIVRRQE